MHKIIFENIHYLIAQFEQNLQILNLIIFFCLDLNQIFIRSLLRSNLN